MKKLKILPKKFGANSPKKVDVIGLFGYNVMEYWNSRGSLPICRQMISLPFHEGSGFKASLRSGGKRPTQQR